MGIDQSKLSYIAQATNIVERDIRLFECADLLNINKSEKEKSFGSIYSQICFDSEFFQGENEKNLKVFLDEYFNPLLSKFILTTPYFKLDDRGRGYNMKKIRLLIFLLTFNTNEVINSKANPDKGIFIFSLLRDDSSENMREAITSEEGDLHELVEIMYHISCIEIPIFYMHEKQNASVKEKISSFEKCKETLIEKIIDVIVSKDNSNDSKKIKAIEPEAFLENFRKNPRFLTTGHIRALGWEIFDSDNKNKNYNCCVIF